MSKPMIGNAVQMHMHMRAFEEAYAAVLKPLCAELSMPQSALDILLFLARKSDEKDRRVTHLAVTEAAEPVVARGRALQAALGKRLMEGLGDEERALFCRCIATISENAKRICTEEKQKENS